MPLVVNVPRLEALKKNVAEIDTRLASLHPRLAMLREEIEKLIAKEAQYLRLFAEADRSEKAKIDQELVEVVEKRASLERECKGIALAVGELEQNRALMSPELQELLLAEQARERAERIEAARQQHEKDRESERLADRALMAAKDRTNKSFFAWRSLLDQQAVDEQQAALAKQKEIWAARSGPHAANQRS